MLASGKEKVEVVKGARVWVKFVLRLQLLSLRVRLTLTTPRIEKWGERIKIKATLKKTRKALTARLIAGILPKGTKMPGVDEDSFVTC